MSGFSEHRLETAVAVLLFEVSRADDDISSLEKARIAEALARSFDMAANELEALLEEAEHEVEQSTSLFPFTRLINEQFSQAEKKALVEQLWRVSFADRKLDRFEEQIIRRIADLLYLPVADVMHARDKAGRD
jgi:uncharacterized tellurite resistance protein B-like protein